MPKSTRPSYFGAPLSDSAAAKFKAAIQRAIDRRDTGSPPDARAELFRAAIAKHGRFQCPLQQFGPER